VATSNFILRPGRLSAETVARVDQGLLVTDLMGFGFNPITGDFSQGAAGFWLENGERAFPVSEVTISVNFDELWQGIDAVGDDLDTRSSVRCPTFRVAKATVAGT
jgi:PmbA protein